MAENLHQNYSATDATREFNFGSKLVVTVDSDGATQQWQSFETPGPACVGCGLVGETFNGGWQCQAIGEVICPSCMKTWITEVLGEWTQYEHFGETSVVSVVRVAQ